jgi:hypothetical protein
VTEQKAQIHRRAGEAGGEKRKQSTNEKKKRSRREQRNEQKQTWEELEGDAGDKHRDDRTKKTREEETEGMKVKVGGIPVSLQRAPSLIFAQNANTPAEQSAAR